MIKIKNKNKSTTVHERADKQYMIPSPAKGSKSEFQRKLEGKNNPIRNTTDTEDRGYNRVQKKIKTKKWSKQIQTG